MANAKSDSEKWDELVREWEIAFRLAQSGQSQIIREMQDCYKGRGSNPTLDEMNRTDELWSNEKWARAAMDAFIKERFG